MTEGFTRSAGDVVLIAIAGALAHGVAGDLLARHPGALFAVCGTLHVLVMPLTINLLLSPWVKASEQALSQTPSALGTLLIWTSAIYLFTSFIVPAVMGMALGASAGAFFAVLFGPYLALGVSVWGYARFDEKSGHKYSRKGATPPEGLMPLASLVLWAYLVAVETMLVVSARSGKTPFNEPAVLLLAVVVGYLPTRMFLWFFGPQHRVEVAVAAFTFLHLCYRLASL